MDKRRFTVCGIVEIEGKVLLVRHTYGVAKGRILLPGGFVNEGELPNIAAERELKEETGITAKARGILAVQSKPDEWCIVFVMEYINGTPVSDGYENNEVLLLEAKDAILRNDITNMSREILKAYLSESRTILNKSDYIPKSLNEDNYVIFGV